MKCLISDPSLDAMLAPVLGSGKCIRQGAEMFFLGRPGATFFATQTRFHPRGQNTRADLNQKFWRNRHDQAMRTSRFAARRVASEIRPAASLSSILTVYKTPKWPGKNW